MPNPWPDPPKGRDHFYYSISLLNPVLCQQKYLKLSLNTRILKVRNVKNRVGKYILGQDAIKASNKFGKLKWNSRSFKNTKGSHFVYPAFSHTGIPLLGTYEQYLRRYDHTDSVVEVRFSKNEKLNSNEMKRIAVRELEHLITALRLIKISGAGLIGPVALEVLKASGVNSGISFGSPNDPILSCPSPYNELLVLRYVDCQEIKPLFLALNGELPISVKLALRRLNLSMTRQAREDQILDAVIGLEAIYLRNAASELTFRLATRSSAHLEARPEFRIELFNKVKLLYEVRSKLVHGGIERLNQFKKLKPPGIFRDEAELVEFARDVLRAACRSTILDLSNGCKWKNYHTNMDNAALSGIKFRC